MWQAVRTEHSEAFPKGNYFIWRSGVGEVQASGCSQEWRTCWLAVRRLVAPKGQWAKLYQWEPGKVPGRKSPPGIVTNSKTSLTHCLYSSAAAAAAKSLQLCLTLCNPINGSPPDSPVPGILQQEHWSGLPFPSIHESEKWKGSRSVMTDPQRPRGLQPTRLLCPWDFPGKITGLGCHCLLCSSAKEPKFNWIQPQSNSCPRASSKTKQSANNWSWFLRMPPIKADHWTDQEIVKDLLKSVTPPDCAQGCTL